MKSESDAELVLAAMLEPFHQEPESTIIVREAWVESPRSVCIVYDDTRYKYGVLGMRVTFPPHARDNDPRSTGEETAATIMEPLGSDVDHLRADANGISWLGILDGGFPRVPGSDDQK
ncbi:MAG: hypothetical protein L0G87_09620 [Renibacterium salmoninarum]|nr:hypothetical protein [Renibacterium salmoninarum]